MRVQGTRNEQDIKEKSYENSGILWISDLSHILMPCCPGPVYPSAGKRLCRLNVWCGYPAGCSR